jgi:hypothetical protein
MEIVWRIFLAAGCVQNARNRPAGLVLTLRDITADGEWARLTTIQPDDHAATTILPFANMKIFPGHQQPLFQSSTPVCLALVVSVLMVAGCGKKPAAQTAPPPVPASAPAVAPSDMDAVLGQLTQVLRKYSFEHQRVPASFSELLVAGNPGPMPAAPAGKKFVIDPKAMRVVLANQ